MTHRYWAFFTATYLGILAFYLIKNKSYYLHKTGWVLLLVLYTQFSLGILNIQTKLSLSVAVMHNGVALILLLTLVTLVYQITSKAKSLNEPNYTTTCIEGV
jgi:cytochrome c oxidase assembly protein subunit 15